jgi:hypothetical protein
MGFIFKNENIKEKRCQVFLTKLYKAVTSLLVLEENAAALIDQTAVKNQIAVASTNPGESYPVLPFGDELCLNWNSLKFDYTSISKFIEIAFSAAKSNPVDKIVYDKNKKSVLMPDYAPVGEENTETVVILPKTRARLTNGFTTFPNLEKYQYDYKSYEILNEVYRAIALILDSAEAFYSTFYTEERDVFFGIDDLPQSLKENVFQLILVYDTRLMDDEIDGRVTLKANEIIDPIQREAVLNIYRETRDRIKFYTMFVVAPLIENYIEDLLFAVNGSRTYDIKFNQTLRVLEVQPLDGGTSEQLVIKHSAEEVFFPFHNKAMLDQFTQGLKSVW